ncbi:MAG: hypothetical protein FJW40_21130 [Acidobacteria bacterium]|nr:hypothetical protein [Acidobacteriota bacterium]
MRTSIQEIRTRGSKRKCGLKLLVAAGGDLNASFRNYRPIHALIQEKPHAEWNQTPPQRLDCLLWMLKHGADPDSTGAWPTARALVVAAFSGDKDFVDALKEAGARLDGFTGAALGDLKLVRQALAESPGFVHARDAGRLTPLQCSAGSRLGRRSPAVRKRLIDVARLLLDHGAQPDLPTLSWGHSVTAAYFAIHAGNAGLLTLLLERGASATAALAAAVWRNDVPLIEILLDHGAVINEARDETKPLLNQMIRWGQVAQSLWLLDRGASPDIPDERGWTALHQAVSRGNDRMLRACLDAGANRTAQDRDGLTPLDLARRLGRLKIIPALAATA